MNKKYWMIILGVIILASLLTYKKEIRYDKYAYIKIENKTFDFGTININDTVNHIFYIKNISKTPFLINKLLPSCNCTTTTNITKRIIKENETSGIEIQFIASDKQVGKVRSAILIEGNTVNGIVKLELIGTVKNE